METDPRPKGAFYMLTEEINFELTTENTAEKAPYCDDDFYPDASF